MANQLWSDERIIAISEALAAHFEREEQMTWRQMARIIEEDIRQIRDEYEALLPDVVTREALRNCLENPTGQTFRDARYALIWLDRLENT